jgi:hypothetical protein
MLITIIGYWCLFVATSGTLTMAIVAVKSKIDHSTHVYLALYFIAAIMALK